MSGRSLTTRLLIGLISAQTIAIMLAMLIFPMVAPFTSFNEIAAASFRQRIQASLSRGADGVPALDPSLALTDYLRNRPRARFAVLSVDRDRLVTGSDEALGSRLLQLRPLFPRPGDSLSTGQSESDAIVIASTASPELGRLAFAMSGNDFQLEDVPNIAASFLPAALPAYGPVIFGALVLAPLVVTMITRPLRRLASEAASIAPGALGRRLDESDLGPELRALARSINAALTRIEDGVTRQRLYAANAAHELRTPIAILGIHVDDLPDGVGKAALEADVLRVRTLVEQLVTVARLGQNHVAMNEEVDLLKLAQDVVADRAPIAIRNRREIALEAKGSAGVFRGNRQAMFSAVANVLDNAVRAEPEGGVVLMVVQGDHVIEVIDHGPGIAPEDAGLIFEPFWRKSDATPGSGLGLAIVREIADRHGVTVGVAETPGGGATFRFNFSPARRMASSSG